MVLLPEGDAVAASLGLAGHVGCAPLQVRNMIQLDYEENPGIKPGDIFGNNDPYYGGVHLADNYTFMPIFYNGELIAWSCAMNHILEVGGALAPGSCPSLSPTHFTDGFSYPLLKIGENFNTFRWFDLMWERQTRMPLFNIIDSKMRVTGAKLMHDKVLEIVEEFGLDYFRKAIREILERERRRVLSFFKERTVPGIYQDVHLGYSGIYKGRMSQLFPEADRDWLLTRCTETQIQSDGSLSIDFEGTVSQDYFDINGYEGAVRLGLSWWWSTMVMYGGTLTTAIDYALKLKAPKGSMFNPDNLQVGTSMAVASGTGLVPNMSRSQCRAMYSRGIIEEVMERNQTSGIIEQEGVFGNDVTWSFTYFSLSGSQSIGGRPYKDGEALCVSIFNPQSDAGEDEEFELYMPPFVVLGKDFLPGDCGYGKYRGGMGVQLVLLVVNPGKMVRQVGYQSNTIDTTCGGTGLSGAYPAPGGWNVAFRDTNMRELIQAGEGYPSTLPEIYRWIEEGKLKVGNIETWGGPTPPMNLKDGDLWVYIQPSNGGWGDPLERDMSLVEKDLNEGWVSPEANRLVYGAIAQHIDEEWKVDRETTAKAQQEMRRRRKERAVSGKEWWAQQRQRVMNKEFSEPVYNLYSDVLKYEKFRSKFMSTWQLPEDYKL
jgi:N-methylhydantoinase B/oxoprolinase/acetone carboxylase alpha subunit